MAMSACAYNQARINAAWLHGSCMPQVQSHIRSPSCKMQLAICDLTSPCMMQDAGCNMQDARTQDCPVPQHHTSSIGHYSICVDTHTSIYASLMTSYTEALMEVTERSGLRAKLQIEIRE